MQHRKFASKNVVQVSSPSSLDLELGHLFDIKNMANKMFKCFCRFFLFSQSVSPPPPVCPSVFYLLAEVLCSLYCDTGRLKN